MADGRIVRYAEREHHVRETWVKAMEARLVREELKKCYRGEGVNHMQNCKELADRYVLMIRENAIKGFITVDKQ
ncbi:MAG: hypothetical protein TREMPRED_003545 [Tremellales sp. Tagirdzhanova-0007]|nr:MAG: hypothetical protein TREMPRED_003545 [Tremellales sp. Tagirdzhanova-0007]